MSKKSELLDRHAKILKIAQDSNHSELLQEANRLYDVIATLDGDEEDGEGDPGGNHPKKPGNP